MLKSPFPYFGGKSKVAADVWHALGDVKHYIEPFCGSCAVLLARPDYSPLVHVETVNDANGWIANAWRAIAFAPDEVLRWCDWPVNHCDKVARTKVLNAEAGSLAEQLFDNVEYFDAKLAGYYVYCQCVGIAAWWSSGKQMPFLGHGGMGIVSIASRPEGARREWLNALADRLKHVRVVCGDWTQVCGGNWQTSGNFPEVGMFFDPPYAVEDRYADCYGKHDSTDVAHAVREWCLERGSRPDHRIVLAGYEEHAELAQHGWACQRWKTLRGGYGNTARNGRSRGQDNRKRECLWFSPHCLHGGLFDEQETRPAADEPGSDEDVP